MGVLEARVSVSYVAPRDDLEGKLQRIWEKTLGRHPIGIHDDFSDLGGHSLLALKLITRVESEMGVRVAISRVLSAPTIAQMARVLADDNDHPPKSLVLLRKGEGPPVVLVHPIGGTVFCYAALAASWPSPSPVYGLQAPGLAPDGEQARTIEAMATAYLHELEAAGVSGFSLGGWSMGGVVALEMACQLVGLGRPAPSVALIDSLPPPAASALLPSDRRQRALHFWEDLASSVGATDRAPPGLLEAALSVGDTSALWQEARRTGVVPDDLDFDAFDRLVKVFDSNAEALARYGGNRYQGDALLFVASDARAYRSPSLAEELWRPWIAGNIQVSQLAGDHYTILRQPAVHQLVEGILRAGRPHAASSAYERPHQKGA